MRGEGRGRERAEVTVHQAAAVAAAAAAESSPAEATVSAESATAEAAAEATVAAESASAEAAVAEDGAAADSISGYIVPSNHQQIDLNVLPGPQPPPAGDLNLTLGAITGSVGAAAPFFPAREAESLNRASQLPLPPDTLEFVYGLVPGNDVLQIFANPLYKPIEGAATKDVQDSISFLSNLVPRDTRRGILLSLMRRPCMPRALTLPSPSGGRMFASLKPKQIDPEHPTNISKTRRGWGESEKIALALGMCLFPDHLESVDLVVRLFVRTRRACYTQRKDNRVEYFKLCDDLRSDINYIPELAEEEAANDNNLSGDGGERVE